MPDGVRLSTKCRLGNPAAGDVLSILEASLEQSLGRLGLDHVDLFFLHNQIIPDDALDHNQGTPRGLFVDAVRPAMEQLVNSGRIRAWGITGIGVPSSILETVQEGPPPSAIQVIANLLDSPGAMARFDGPARPREIAEAARDQGLGVMGIRAVQAGALTDSFDRELAEDHPDMADYRRAEPFRAVAREIGESTASLSHRYSLTMARISTVVLGVKNRTELRECIEAAERGPLEPVLVSRIDAAVSSV